MSTEALPRIIGTEMEYSRGEHLTKKTCEPTDFLPPGVYSMGQFLSNGARFYQDLGEKFEYATPECAGARDATAAEFAGQQIVYHAVEKLISENKLTRVPLRKCVVDDKGKTWGYHENYGMRRADYDSQVHREFLIAHLASRAVLMGAGQIVRQNDGAYRTLPAQKIQAAKKLTSSNYDDKAIFNTRDEAHADNEQWARQHVVCGDPNITRRMTFLKLGSTSVVIRLGETGVGSSDYLPEEHGCLPFAITAGNDPSMTALAKTRNGKTLSALCIQENLLEQGERLAEKIELPRDELEALALWRTTLDAAKADDPDQADRIIEWRAKQRLLDKFTETQARADGLKDTVQALNNAWDHLDPKKNIGLRWLRDHRDTTVARELIDQYITTSPPHTRALERAGFIRNNHSQSGDFSINWACGHIGMSSFNVPHPYGRQMP